MKVLISGIILALIATTLVAGFEQPPATSAENNAERQGKSLSGNGGSNLIEHSSSKSRYEQERRQVQDFLSAKNLVKTVIKLIFGNQDEISASSRNVLGILSKVSRGRSVIDVYHHI